MRKSATHHDKDDDASQAPEADPVEVRFAAIMDEIAAAFHHLADMIPSAAPLHRAAASIEAHLAAAREIIHPGPPADGPQHDHS